MGSSNEITRILKVATFGQAVRWNGHRVSSQRTPQFRPTIGYLMSAVVACGTAIETALHDRPREGIR